MTQLKTEGIGVSQNEIKCNHTLNRMFGRLLSNDIQNQLLYKEIYGKIGITDFQSGGKYNIGDLVWFVGQKWGKLYLLKCISNGAITDRLRELGDTDYQISQNFLSQGWKNQNEYITILDLGIEAMLSSMVNAQLQSHQNDPELHPYGKISMDEESDGYLGKKILKLDLDNVNKDRETNKYPYKTVKLTPDNVIINGTYRIYDNKILEYDILFKFGSQDSTQQSNFGNTQELCANNMVFEEYQGIGGRDYYDNSKYFKDHDSQTMFSTGLEGKDGTSEIGIQKNSHRNNFVNAYFARISLPKSFSNTNYCIFANTVMSQGEHGNVIPSQNEIVFCNKARGSLVAVNIMNSDSGNYFQDGEESNARNGGLAANCFHCKIIGIGE